MKACAGLAPPRSALPSRERRTAPTTVTPSSPATSRDALSRADAMPDCSAGAPSSTALVSGTFISPAPRPNSTNPGSRPVNVAPAPSPANSTRPTVMIAIPSATVRCPPMTAVTRGDSIAATARHSAIGTNARPALVGENPRMPCRYSEVKK